MPPQHLKLVKVAALLVDELGLHRNLQGVEDGLHSFLVVDLLDAHVFQLLFTFPLKAAIEMKCHLFRREISCGLQLPNFNLLAKFGVSSEIFFVVFPARWCRRLAGLPPDTFCRSFSRGPISTTIPVNQLLQGFQKLPICRCHTPRVYFRS